MTFYKTYNLLFFSELQLFFFAHGLIKKCWEIPSTLHKTKTVLKTPFFEVIAYPIGNGRGFLCPCHIIGAPLFEAGRNVFNLSDARF